MVNYSFTTRDKIEAPPKRIWEVLENIEAIPDWWSTVHRAQIIGPNKELKIGRQIHFSVKGLLGNLCFTVKVTEFKPPHRMKLQSNGDLIGHGLFILEEEDGFTNLTYYWEVTTTGKLMNFCGRVLKPLLIHSHNRVMKRGLKNLRRII